jgi:nucleoside-diphosphate-sugar epimerase
MRILLTGASGFLGSICKPFLVDHHEVLSIGRNTRNQIIADLATCVPELPSLEAVIHAAGKAHVYPRTDAEKQAFFDVNVKGTKHLLEALEPVSIKAFIFISSVSVYGMEQGSNIPEETPLNGRSPYALSKIQAEEMIVSWCLSHGVDYLILRLPLIAGSKPLGNLGKMMKAIQRGRYLRIAKGEANKSMVLATDVGKLMATWLTSSKRVSGIYNLTDGIHPSFYQLEEGLKLLWKIKYIPAIPKWLGYVLGKLGDNLSWFPVNSGTIRKITGTFTFSDEKARREIGWSPRSVLAHLNELL